MSVQEWCGVERHLPTTASSIWRLINSAVPLTTHSGFSPGFLCQGQLGFPHVIALFAHNISAISRLLDSSKDT